MQVVPSIFHQCVNFSYKGIDITIHGNPNLFQYCNNLKVIVANQVLINQATPLVSQLKSLTIADTWTTSTSSA